LGFSPGNSSCRSRPGCCRIAFALALLKRTAEIYRSFEEPFAALALAGLAVLSYRLWKRREISLRAAVLYGAAWAAALYISFSLAPVSAQT
jgi:hypothetical protein